MRQRKAKKQQLQYENSNYAKEELEASAANAYENIAWSEERSDKRATR